MSREKEDDLRSQFGRDKVGGGGGGSSSGNSSGCV